MNDHDFWHLIDAAKMKSEGACEAQAETLQVQLSELPADQIAAFDHIFMTLHRRAYRWDLWGAAYIINGGCSDDGFHYFRAWLIGQGEDIYENALKDPETLADVKIVDGEAECEDLLYAAGQAYEAKTGSQMPSAEYPAQEPGGEPWEEDDLEGLFPRLSARFEEESMEGPEE